jgi:hypothetical protein
MKKIVITLLLFISKFFAHSNSFVTVEFKGQLGNNLFQVATASALAWDNKATPSFPELKEKTKYKKKVYKHVLFRCNTQKLKKKNLFEWHDPSFSYDEIEYTPNMKLFGYFQSEKYFAHHRENILELFAPNEKDLNYIKKKYEWIIDHPNSVGVQIRDYYKEDKTGKRHVQYGIDYLSKAMKLFPEDTLFVVSSNNIKFAKKNIPDFAKNVVFLNEQFYIEFFILSLCKHNIITNSTFGWWAAWLNKNTDKIVICPHHWINGRVYKDICPKRWVKIKAKYGCVGIPGSY